MSQPLRPPQVILPCFGRTTVTKLDPAWLEAFDKELLYLFAIDHGDAGMDEYLLGCYADLPPREAALAFGSDYDLERDDALWPRSGLGVQS
ncbi:hypothetical protein BU225_17780 [Stenotrophomonas sp. MB339]|nr:hypothetical protein [Stenotrophomonas maltophilia]MBA0240999.1 hypothetical protein [Stenotrophomonas maltophilia]OMO39591.1 hypothetical protein BU225_17780 [Stenotrophomonas sp. MB339]